MKKNYTIINHSKNANLKFIGLIKNVLQLYFDQILQFGCK